MSEYVLDHQQEGERERLALMSRLLDPLHRRESNNWPSGRGRGRSKVAVETARYRPGGQGDIVAGPVESRDFDLVTARAVLHHVPDAHAAVANLVASTRPGGVILLIEPPEHDLDR